MDTCTHSRTLRSWGHRNNNVLVTVALKFMGSVVDLEVMLSHNSTVMRLNMVVFDTLDRRSSVDVMDVLVLTEHSAGVELALEAA